MNRIIIESPFAGDVAGNLAYLKKAVQDALTKGESPYASHAFFTQFLDDNNPQERELGILAGLEWSRAADSIVFYLDRGMSSGMRFALKKHLEANRPVYVRKMLGNSLLAFSYKEETPGNCSRRASFRKFFLGKHPVTKEACVYMQAHCTETDCIKSFFLDDVHFAVNAKA